MSKSSGEKNLSIGREHIECDACLKPNPKMRCSRCQCDYYCDKSCQKRAWKFEHKRSCPTYCKERDKDLIFDDDAPIPPPDATPINTDCYLCLSEPMTKPFTLPQCGHTFCFTCLHKAQVAAPGELCPVCRVKGPNVVLATNIHLLLHRYRAKCNHTDPVAKKMHNQIALEQLERLELIESGSAEKIKWQVRRAQNLLDLEKPDEALKICENIEAKCQEGDKRYLELLPLMVERDLARKKDGLPLEYKSIDMVIREEKEKFAYKLRVGMEFFEVLLAMGQCKEAKGDYRGAMDVYERSFKIAAVYAMDHDLITDLAEIRNHENLDFSNTQACFELKRNICRSWYHLGNYQESIKQGTWAIEKCRIFRDSHKYVALSQKATGDVRAAVRTMGRAINHEAPWDKNLRATNIKLYEELMEAVSSSSASK